MIQIEDQGFVGWVRLAGEGIWNFAEGIPLAYDGIFLAEQMGERFVEPFPEFLRGSTGYLFAEIAPVHFHDGGQLLLCEPFHKKIQMPPELVNPFRIKLLNISPGN